MTNRQPGSTGFHAQQLPTLQPGTMRLIYAEQFQVLHDVKPGGPYACAMEWPDGWETWDPGSAQIGDYADAAMGCGIVQCQNPDSAGGFAASGKLRAWPEPNLTVNRSYKVFARVAFAGMQPGNATECLPNSGGSGELMIANLLISGEDLLGTTPGGKFFSAGVNTVPGMAGSWADYATPTELVTVVPPLVPQYVQFEITYDAGDDLTSVTPSVSDDGVAFFKPNSTEFTPWLFAGPPRVFGLLGLHSSDNPGTSAKAMRLDYVAVFADDDQQVTASEGGRNYY